MNKFFVLAVALAVFSVSGVARTHDTNPFSSPEDLETGKRMYRASCGVCHGMQGTTGRGARLARKVHRLANSDAEMFDLLEKGSPGTDMPGLWLDEDDIWKILLFVRTLEENAEEPCVETPGDAAVGKAVFYNKGSCATCHTVGMGGGRLGPDMSHIGAGFSRDQLRTALVEPSKDVATRYLAGRVETKDGRTHEGVVMKENGYSLFLMDRSEELLSFEKADLKSFEVAKESLMPAYGGILSPADMDHLLAFMCTLRGSEKGASE